jgi:hypothetical protein
MKTIDEYIQLFDTYKDKVGGKEMHRELRLFDIRFRLALDTDITFIGDYSYTKTKEVRDCYKLIFKLTNLWNAYEALFDYIKVYDKINKRSSIKKSFTHSITTESGSYKFLLEQMNELISLSKSNANFKKDMIEYGGKIGKDNIFQYISTSDANKAKHLLEMIYQERNNFYHNGESGRMGMSYPNRKKLLAFYIECLTSHILYGAIWVFTNEENG